MIGRRLTAGRQEPLLNCLAQLVIECFDEMLRLQTRMEQALAQWDVMLGGIPDGHSVCHLIESFEQDDWAGDETGEDYSEPRD